MNYFYVRYPTGERTLVMDFYEARAYAEVFQGKVYAEVGTPWWRRVLSRTTLEKGVG
jgi:hypothetical protein